MPDSENLSDRQLLLDIHSRLASIEAKLSMWRWIYGATVTAGAAWMSWLTIMFVSMLD